MPPEPRFVRIDGATVTLGDDSAWSYPADGESRRSMTLRPFEISSTAVSNADFAAFVDATAYSTTAERLGWSFVFGGLLPDDFPDTRAVAAAPWWRQVFGASWRRPEGASSEIEDRHDHPVVHVSHDDASEYASWAGARLATEAEWEHAARAGATTVFPWGEELAPGGRHRMNVFQGEFPAHDTGEDGWIGTCPVTAYEPNRLGLSNMLGNVWEWTADWFDDGSQHVLKGGSYLCHASYCRRYRPAARMGSAADSTAGNVGFRCARDA
jgi:sulfatase modifying factor 1